MDTSSHSECQPSLDIASFVELSEHTLQKMDEAIIGVDENGRDYNAIAHIINLMEKILAPARQLELEDIVSLLQELGCYLERIQSEVVPLNSDVVLRLFSCRYLLNDLVRGLSDNPQGDGSAKDKLRYLLHLMRCDRDAVR